MPDNDTIILKLIAQANQTIRRGEDKKFYASISIDESKFIAEKFAFNHPLHRNPDGILMPIKEDSQDLAEKIRKKIEELGFNRTDVDVTGGVSSDGKGYALVILGERETLDKLAEAANKALMEKSKQQFLNGEKPGISSFNNNMAPTQTPIIPKNDTLSNTR